MGYEISESEGREFNISVLFTYIIAIDSTSSIYESTYITIEIIFILLHTERPPGTDDKLGLDVGSRKSEREINSRGGCEVAVQPELELKINVPPDYVGNPFTYSGQTFFSEIWLIFAPFYCS